MCDVFIKTVHKHDLIVLVCVCVCVYLWVVEGGDDSAEAVGVNLQAAEERHQQDATHTAHIHTC